MTAIVVAMARRNVIGKNGMMPWAKIPADLRYFKELTMGHTIVMGRKTYESIGRPLPGRLNMVLTHQKLGLSGCVEQDSMANFLSQSYGDDKIFVIGGGEVYKQAIHAVDRLYVTLVNQFCEGDVFFPEIDPFIWREISCVPGGGDEKTPPQFWHVVFERRR